MPPLSRTKKTVLPKPEPALAVEKSMVILALIDSPTLPSGFSCVGKNFFKLWQVDPRVKRIDVWGIGFRGYDYDKFPWKIFPGGVGGEWHKRLDSFLELLIQGDYTHVFILQDLDMLSQDSFPEKLRAACVHKNIRSVVYFPVDCPTEPAFTRILSYVDVPVAYTHYGKTEAEAKAVIGKQRVTCEIVPHGIDPEIYRPIFTTPEQRAAGRKKAWELEVEPGKENWYPFLTPDDFTILNVNTNQWRKDVLRTLEIFARLLEGGMKAKLVMHMRNKSPAGAGGIDLESAGRQLGLQLGKDWLHTDSAWPNRPELCGLSKLPETVLQTFYNVSDLYLSTTLGEGWGLPMTEALACGTAIAIPNHTACAELAGNLSRAGMDKRIVLLPPEPGFVMADARLRSRVDLLESTKLIRAYYETGEWRKRVPLTLKAADYLSWGNAAGKMLDLLAGPKKPVEIAKRTHKLEL